jgi:hypothetical protein
MGKMRYLYHDLSRTQAAAISHLPSQFHESTLIDERDLRMGTAGEVPTPAGLKIKAESGLAGRKVEVDKYEECTSPYFRA